MANVKPVAAVPASRLRRAIGGEGGSGAGAGGGFWAFGSRSLFMAVTVSDFIDVRLTLALRTDDVLKDDVLKDDVLKDDVLKTTY
ncbi:hypothetical protein ACIQPT_08335 [Streptomyces sp. NPDC091289]|uniref:hypothetical protein n=1 Tax=Streptomyces sp. NPDC091289 TaxID=3365989 RepID=UPI003809CDAA